MTGPSDSKALHRGQATAVWNISFLMDRIEFDTVNGCWLWSRAVSRRGYGTVATHSGRSAYAHRLAFELFKGPIPPGMQVLHSCDTPLCTNPDHLRLGSPKDNMADMSARRRQSKGAPYKRVRGEKLAAIQRDQTTPVRVLAAALGIDPNTVRRRRRQTLEAKKCAP